MSRPRGASQQPPPPDSQHPPAPPGEPDAAHWWALVAPAVAGRARMRLADRHGKYPPTGERDLTTDRPARPAAVLLHDHTGRLHTLAVDLDAKHGHTRAHVRSDTTDLVAVLTAAGLLPWVDQSPTGGRHVYARLDQPLPIEAVRALTAGLAARYRTVDTSGLNNPKAGCIRPTGAAHPLGGVQTPLTAPDVLTHALTSPVPAGAAQRLLAALPAPPAPVGDQQPLDVPAAGDGWVTIRGRHLPAHIDALATDGPTGPRWTGRFPSQSEARWHIIWWAVRRGMTLPDLTWAATHRWTWLRHSYARKQGHTTMARDFAKQQSHARGTNPARQMDTRPSGTQGGTPAETLTRRWLTHALTVTTAGRTTPQLRALVLAVAFYANVRARRDIDVGVRSLAEAVGVSRGVAAAGLHDLARLGLIERVQLGRGIDADRWRLLTGHRVHQAKPWRGRIRPPHRVFWALGMLPAEIHRHLTRHPGGLSARDIAIDVGCSTRAAHDALATLHAWGMARRDQHGWVHHHADLDALADHLDVDETAATAHQRHTRERAAWHAWLDRRWQHTATTPGANQLRLEEIAAALHHDNDDWIADYATGTSPPRNPHTAAS